MLRRFLTQAGPVLGSVLILVACSKAEAPQEPVRSVKLITVGASSTQAVQEYAGEVRPRIESRLGFRVAGKLIRRNVELGQRVQAGQVLAQIDPQDYQLAADAVQAQLAAAATQRDLAAADLRRFRDLREQNFISGAELERREAAFKAAQAQVDQAQAQLAVQRNQGRYATLVADAAGVVTAIEAEIGQVVAAGAPVVRLAQDGPRDVVISVPEDKLGRMSARQVVQVRLWPSSETVPAQVREVGASADPVTRTYPVRIGLPPQAAAALGATATVVLAPQPAGAMPAVIKLPTSALRQEGAATVVWVLDEASMTVRLQPVAIATADGNEAVVASGLQPGMRVVAAGVHVLTPGQKVRVYQDRNNRS